MRHLRLAAALCLLFVSGPIPAWAQHRVALVPAAEAGVGAAAGASFSAAPAALSQTPLLDPVLGASLPLPGLTGFQAPAEPLSPLAAAQALPAGSPITQEGPSSLAAGVLETARRLLPEAAGALPDGGAQPLEGQDRLDSVYSGSPRRGASPDVEPVSPGSADGAPRPSLDRAKVVQSKPTGLARIAAPIREFISGGDPVERRMAWLSFAWFFLTIATYTMVAPVRNALLLHKFGSDILPWVYMGSALATGAAVWVYTKFTGLPRKAFMAGTLGVLSSSFLLWWGLALAAPVGWIPFPFYIWTDVFGIMSVTLFWTYANDVFTKQGAKKFFGFIAAAGPLGTILGSAAAKLLIGSLGVLPMLWVAAAVYGSIFFAFLALERLAAKRAAQASEPEKEERPSHKGVLRLILSSKFLTFLTILVALERFVPDFSNYIFGSAIDAAHHDDPKAIGDISATFQLWQGVASAILSIAFTGLFFRAFGVTGALMVLPLANMLGLGFYAALPSLKAALGLNGVEGVLRYTWFKSAKETTYTGTGKDVVYRVKAFVEMFVYRFARGIAGFVLLLLTVGLGLGVPGVAVVGALIALVWLWVAWKVGRMQDAQPKAKEPAKGSGG